MAFCVYEFAFSIASNMGSRELLVKACWGEGLLE